MVGRTMVARAGGAALAAVLLVACDKTNTVDATSIDCGDDAVRCIPCEPGELTCDGASLLRCKPDGRGFAIAAECESVQLCVAGIAGGDAGVGCAEPVCQGDEARCTGAVMQICAAGRHAFELVECSSEDACVRGLAGRRCADAECSQANDCAGQDTQCRRRVCDHGRCASDNLPANTACVIREVNGICDGEGSCLPMQDACSISADCPGEDTACRVRACVGSQCGFANTPQNTPCTADQLAGACDGMGNCVPAVQCNTASDCPGSDTHCRIRACVAGSCGFADLPADTACERGGIPGVCDGRGGCMAGECSIAGDCPGIDTPCRVRACADGICGFTDMAAETPCAVDGLTGICDGMGGCTITQQCRTANDCPAQPNPCRTAACSAQGRCTTSNVNGACQMGDSVGQCSGGNCQCPNGTVFCGNRCVNTNTDTSNCGRCGNQCNVGIGELCDAGRCECPGEDDWSGGNCGGRCVSLLTSENCGDCNVRCGQNQVCRRAAVGRHSCGCADGTEDCGFGCVPLNTDEHCGACGLRCPAGTRCNNRGRCACTTPGYRVCNSGILCPHRFCMDPNTPRWAELNCRGADDIEPFRSACGHPEQCCDWTP